MKRLTVVLIIMALMLFSFNVFAQAQSSWSVKAGIDFGSTIDIDDSENESGMGYSLIAELKMPYRQNLNLGAGLTYQLDREDEVANENFGFTPFYGLAEYSMQNNPLYFLGHFGYAGFRYDNVTGVNGGLYYALGGGMNFDPGYEAEILYTKNSGEINNAEVDYSKITVTFGMKF